MWRPRVVLKGETRPSVSQQWRYGTFTDVSEKGRPFGDKSAYYGLASLFIDVNDDGKPDLLVADDFDAETISISTRATAPSRTRATPPVMR